MDSETGAFAGDGFGICDRSNNCGYHQKPVNYVIDHVSVVEEIKPTTYIDLTVLRQKNENNSFIKGLQHKYENITQAITNYFLTIGTPKQEGAVIFWYVDIKGQIRSGKHMLYSGLSRVKTEEPRWEHSGIKDFVFSRCFFGEHLIDLTDYKPIAIVESEKTAVICSLLYPKYKWLATGGALCLSQDMCRVILEYPEIHLFPDNGSYAVWQKSIDLNPFLHKPYVYSFMELADTGKDIADYL